MSNWPQVAVKVCGVTRSLDIRVVSEAGADAVGFVHHPPSPRHLPTVDIKPLAALLPQEVTAVGVVVGLSPGDALSWAMESGVDALQICGAARAEDWAGFQFPLWRSLPLSGGCLGEAAAWRQTAQVAVLDSPIGLGGTGRVADWGVAAACAAVAPSILAGGLSPSNVRAAVTAVAPCGVDASSSLESSPGRKDAGLVRAFVAEARSALGVA